MKQNKTACCGKTAAKHSHHFPRILNNHSQTIPTRGINTETIPETKTYKWFIQASGSSEWTSPETEEEVQQQ